MLYANPGFSKNLHTWVKVYMDQATVSLVIPEGKKWEEKEKLWGPLLEKLTGTKLLLPDAPLYRLNPKEEVLQKPRPRTAMYLAHANCTPFLSPKHLDFVTEKNSFFCHLENSVFQTLPKNPFFISFAHFLLFLGGSNNHSLFQNQRLYRSFSPKKILLANLKNTNFWIVWKTIKDGRCLHIRYMST